MVGAAYFESFAAGLGTSAYLAFLMSVCEKRYAATQFAVLSALLALTRWIAGDFSGGLAERVGYANYFLVTFLIGLPAFALIPQLAKVSRHKHQLKPSISAVSHRATASCISRWRCQASRTGAFPGDLARSRGWPNSTTRSAPDA